MKRTLILLLTIIMILNLCSCTEKMITPTEKGSTTTQMEIQAPATEKPKDDTDYSEDSFAIHYIDVGQGDTSFLFTGDAFRCKGFVHFCKKTLHFVLDVVSRHPTQTVSQSMS